MTLVIFFTKVPFITSGEDAGHREVKFETGDLSNGYIVEDIQEEDGFMHRRLIFKKNPRIVQTESRLVSGEHLLGNVLRVIQTKRTEDLYSSNNPRIVKT